MKKISAIIPVYNEERLLPALLNNISPHVDEIVIVDGSPEGPSTDGTKEIAKSCEKVQYQSGKFVTLDGAWDVTLQRNQGINLASGDIVLMLSADNFFLGLERLRAAVEDDEFKLFFCTTLEFWMDIRHLRIYSADSSITTISSNLMEVLAINVSLNPYYEEDAQLILDKAYTSDKKIIPQMVKFHLGFMRPFPEQVEKHIRHVHQHRWEDLGENLLRGGERGLQQWAMRHVLSYGETASRAWEGAVPPELEQFKDMTSSDGADACVKEFERKYGLSPFKQWQEVAS